MRNAPHCAIQATTTSHQRLPVLRIFCARSVPLWAFPTAVRTGLAIAASLIAHLPRAFCELLAILDIYWTHAPRKSNLTVRSGSSRWGIEAQPDLTSGPDVQSRRISRGGKCTVR